MTFSLLPYSQSVVNRGIAGILAGETCAMSNHSTKPTATHQAMMTSCAGPSTVDPPET
jgi:hypothetical protein